MKQGGDTSPHMRAQILAAPRIRARTYHTHRLAEDRILHPVRDAVQVVRHALDIGLLHAEQFAQVGQPCKVRVVGVRHVQRDGIGSVAAAQGMRQGRF